MKEIRRYLNSIRFSKFKSELRIQDESKDGGYWWKKLEGI